MRPAKNVLVSLLYLAIGAACLAESAPGALATEAEANGPPPTVSFLDQQPLSLDKAKVEELAEAGVLEVKVHNGRGRAQQVSLELVGFEEATDPGIAALFTKTRDTHQVGAGQTSPFTLTLTQPNPEPSEGTYKATLLAAGESGGLARRELTITYPPAAGMQESGGENSLSPDRTIDITMRAVNFLPSLLSNLIALGIFLAIALLVVAYLFKDWLRHVTQHLPTALTALAVLVGAITLFGVLENGAWDSPSFHAISSEPIDLSPKVPEGTRGTVSSEDGTIAQLIASDRRLRPENLDGANKYTGKYNLGGEAGKAEAAAIVTIRDYWIWAVITITLGLLIGFLLHRWFQEKRPKAKLRSRLEKLRRDYDAEVDETDTRIDSRLRAREVEIEGLLDAGEATLATEKLHVLSLYLDRFFALRQKLRNLDNAIQELVDTPDLESLGLDLEEARGYQEARKLLGAPVDSLGLDSDEAELKGQFDKVNAMTTLIEGTSSQVRKSIRHREIARGLRHAVEGPTMVKLGEIEVALAEAGLKALQANSAKDLEAAEDADDKALRDLTALKQQIAAGPNSMKIERVALDFALMARDPIDASGLEATVAELSIGQPPDRADFEAGVEWEVPSADEPQDKTIHIEDRVRFSIKIDAGDRRMLSGVEIDFGDNSRGRYNLPRPGTPLRVTHPYLSAQPATVVVRSVPDGTELGRLDLPPIDPKPRLLASQRQLAESDRIVERAAFLLAVGSGMVALYFVNPSWGQPMDYLAAFLWGGATGEGVKFAAGIADRVWPVP